MTDLSHATPRQLVAVNCDACETQSVFTRDPEAGGLNDLVETHPCPSCGKDLKVTLPLELGQVIGYDAPAIAADAVDRAYREGLEKPASAKRILLISAAVAGVYATVDYVLTEPEPLRAAVVFALGFIASLFSIGAVLTMSQSGYLTRLAVLVRKELSADPVVCPSCQIKTFRRGLAGELSCAACDRKLVVTPLLLVEGEGAVEAKAAFEAAALELATEDRRLRLEPSRRDWILGTAIAVLVLAIIATPDWFGL